MSDFKLDSRPNIKSGFKAPDSYFESLTERIMLNLPIEEVKVIPLYRRRPVWVTSAAAALVLSLSLVVSKNEASAPVIDDAAAADYLLYQEGISYVLEKNIDKKDIKKYNAETADNISDEAIEEYLSSQDITSYE